jgi:signal transduction histidine kinase
LISQELINFQHLEDKAGLLLEHLKLRQSFRTLLSDVSHDLASPLGYLKFSTEILLTQLGKKASEDLTETARVISSSTSKLSEEANQLVENGKLNLNPSKTQILLVDLVESSINLSGIKPDIKLIKGNSDIKLQNEEAELYTYILCSILNTLTKLELELKSIKAEKCKDDFNLKLQLSENSKELDRLKKEVKRLNNKLIFTSVMDYLGANIVFSKENDNSIEVNLIFSN